MVRTPAVAGVRVGDSGEGKLLSAGLGLEFGDGVLVGGDLELGLALGLTFQQVQKYEKGTNRVGASRIQQISEILEVPVSFLFDGGPSGRPSGEGFGEAASPAYVSDFLASSEGLALTRAFTRIGDPKLRRSIVELVEQIAAREAAENA